MVREIFNIGMRSIEAAGIRIFKPEHLETLYKDLMLIDDNTFNFLVKEFIEIEHPPKSITGYFLRRAREINTEKSNFIKHNTLAWTEYTPEDFNLFFKCVRRSLQIWVGTSDEYKAWCKWFNNNWMEKNDEELTIFLRQHYEVLKNTKSVRTNFPNVIF